jgi:hypothetical protein
MPSAHLIKKGLPGLVLGAGIQLLFILVAAAAPIRPVGPLDVTGTVSEVRRVPERLIKGTPGASGSLGRDRIEAAHLLVKLIDYEGITPETARIMTHYLNESASRNTPDKDPPPFVLLRLGIKNPDQMRPGLRIRVTGYKVAGDEGGTWTAYTEITFLGQR